MTTDVNWQIYNHLSDSRRLQVDAYAMSAYGRLPGELTSPELATALAEFASNGNGAANGSGPKAANGDAIHLPRPLPLAQLLKRDFPPLVFLVDGILAKGHLAMLGGRPKSGKSWLVLQLAQAIDRGLTFLDRETRRGRVLYIALEDGERRIYQRTNVLRWQPTDGAAVLFDIAHFDGSDGMPGPGLAQIAALADDFDLIIIDTLIATLSGRASENDNVQMGMIVNELARIAHTSETAVLLVHHTSKGNSENVFDLLRGASALRGAYDVGLLLERKQDEREGILHMESRDVDLSNMTIRQAGDGAGWECLGNGSEINRIRAGRRVVEALRENGDGLTAEEVGELLKVSRQAAGAQLRGAESAGLVRRESERREGSTKPVDIWYLKE